MRTLTTIQRKNSTTGFTLIEMVVYIAGMTVVLAGLTYFTVQIYGLHASMMVEARADRAASTVTQILASHIRSGVTIDQSESLFGVAQGVLAIEARDETNTITRVFSVDSDRVLFTEDGVETYLTPDDMYVSKFLITQIVTPASYAVRYEIDLTFTKNDTLVTKTYPGLVVLRHSYD